MFVQKRVKIVPILKKIVQRTIVFLLAFKYTYMVTLFP